MSAPALTERPQVAGATPGGRGRSNDPYDQRRDLVDVIALRHTDSRTRDRAIDDLIADLTARQLIGREVNTISARPAAAWFIAEVAAGRRVIGQQDVVDRFGLSRSTVGRMLKQLRASGILWCRWTGKKGIGNSIWSLAPRAVLYLVTRVRRRREKIKAWKAQRKMNAHNKSQVNVSNPPTEFAPGSREGNLSTPPAPTIDRVAAQRAQLARLLGRSQDDCEHGNPPNACAACRRRQQTG